jgi:hypothetical protein
MNCRKVNTKLADLLLDPESVPAELRRHVEECASCGQELAALRSTMDLLDHWALPEVNPFFDARLLARVRAESQAEPAGFWERLKSRFIYGSNLRLQPLMAGALGVVILVGGGTYADLVWQARHQTDESAMVHDLQSFDGNAQVLQQLDSIDQAATPQDEENGSSSSD